MNNTASDITSCYMKTEIEAKL